MSRPYSADDNGCLIFLIGVIAIIALLRETNKPIIDIEYKNGQTNKSTKGYLTTSEWKEFNRRQDSTIQNK